MEKENRNEWMHQGIFGALSHERTNLVKQMMEEMNRDQVGKVMIFDPHAHYGNPENRTIETFTMGLLHAPKQVPHVIWADALTEIIAATFHLGQRASLTLNKAIVDLFTIVEKEEKKEEMVHFLLHLKKTLDRELEERRRETGGRLFFVEQEVYDHLFYSLRIVNDWFSPLEDTSPPDWQLDNPSEEKPTVYALFESGALQQTLFMNLTIAREFYTRKYNETMRKEPLLVVLEHAHLLFSKETKSGAMHASQSFIHQLLREAKHYGIYFIFVTENEEELMPLVGNVMTKKQTLFENDIPQEKPNKKELLFVDWDIQDENEIHALIENKEHIYFVFDDYEKMKKASDAYAKWLRVYEPTKNISFSLLNELVKIL